MLKCPKMFYSFQTKLIIFCLCTNHHIYLHCNEILYVNFGWVLNYKWILNLYWSFGFLKTLILFLTYCTEAAKWYCILVLNLIKSDFCIIQSGSYSIVVFKKKKNWRSICLWIVYLFYYLHICILFKHRKKMSEMCVLVKLSIT